MNCYKCNVTLDWVGDYHEVTIQTHDFKNLNIKPLRRIWACIDCGVELND